MAQRDYPYSNFNYIVNLGGETGSGDSPIGGFSEVQGISTEMNYADYRAGNAKTNTMSKYPNTHKLGTLTLKRGLMGTLDLWNWLKAVRDGAYQPRDITITLQDEQHRPVMSWKFQRAQPQKWTAPNLAAKGGTDVAIEEFVLVYEGYTVESL
jgi:phage tail-like protein